MFYLDYSVFEVWLMVRGCAWVILSGRVVSLSRCEKTSLAGLVYSEYLRRFSKLVKSFHDRQFIEALQVLLHSIWIKMFWIERCASPPIKGYSIGGGKGLRENDVMCRPTIAFRLGLRLNDNNLEDCVTGMGGESLYTQRRNARKGKRQIPIWCDQKDTRFR